MVVNIILGALTLLSVGLLLWQFVAAMRFPVHQREPDNSFTPPITILKPVKGSGEHTRNCLRSWFTQTYRGNVQILFGVADEGDPVCDVIRELLEEFPWCEATLVITREALGANAKVSNLVQLMGHAKHDIICVSDADVRAPEDFLSQAVTPLRDANAGLVNSFYRLANPATLAMRWEAIAVNADFWSQVLQSNTLKPQDFALGAVMIVRREDLKKIGGFSSLLDYLADDYQLGHRIAESGKRIILSRVVVECWDRPMSFRDVWNHQLRWARTIRVSQPVAYFFSILSNVALWSILLGVLTEPGRFTWLVVGIAMVLRAFLTMTLAVRLTESRSVLAYWWLTPVKDLLQVAIWAGSFLGHTVEWGGKKFRLKPGGKLVPL